MKHLLITVIFVCHAALAAAQESLEVVLKPEALQP